MSTKKTKPTQEKLTEANALRDQAAELLRRAGDLDGKALIILIADYRDGQPSLFIEFSSEDLMDDKVAREHLRASYEIRDGYELLTFDADVKELAGARA